MKENKLVDLSMDFAIKIIKLCQTIKGHYSCVNQLERSAPRLVQISTKRIMLTARRTLNCRHKKLYTRLML